MVGTDTSTKKGTSFTYQRCRPSQEEEETAPQMLEPFVPICFEMGASTKNQVENGLSQLSNFRGHTIDVYEQAILTLTYSDLHDEQGKKINIRDPLTEVQRQPGSFLSFMMMVHPDQADRK